MTDQLINQESLPQHLIDAQQKGSTGLEDAAQYIVPPRLKVCQAKREGEYKAFSQKDVIVTPQLEKICGEGGFFVFTPIYFFDEFCVHNPYALKSLPFIRERSLDPKSELADKCRRMVREVCPEDESQEIAYVTHLNFLIAIHDIPELAGIPVLISFYLGEFKSGSGMLGLLRMRCNNGTPIYAHKLMARPADHRNSQFEWDGLDISNPTADYDGQPIVTDPEQFAQFEELHEQMKRDKERIYADYEDPSVPESDTL